MLFDAHTHISGQSYHRQEGFCQLAVGSTAEECAFLQRACCEDEGLYYAVGVHPWRSADVDFETLAPYLDAAVAVGEIGLDVVWTDVDLSVQRRVFRQQLDWAEAHGLPVVLHAKGCEKEVLDCVAGFRPPVLVHWYSSELYLEDYIARGYYFTVGPDVESSAAVAAVAAKAPLERLLVESDGAEGAAWALGRAVAPADVPAVLRHSIACIARMRKLPAEAVEKAVFDNAVRFVTARAR